jgi:hypothetical protein
MQLATSAPIRFDESDAWPSRGKSRRYLRRPLLSAARIFQDGVTHVWQQYEPGRPHRTPPSLIPIR